MKSYVYGIAAFAGGATIGFVAGLVMTEGRLRTEYAESAASLRRSYELAHQMETDKVEPPAESEEELEQAEADVVALSNYNEIRSKYAVKDKPDEGAAEWQKPPVVFDPVVDQGLSYIEEEDFLDDDGRNKGHVDILIDDGQPTFLKDGEPLEDWQNVVGEDILVDFYKMVPPGFEQVLYIRNHNTDEDLEVVMVVP